ncbi:hypothetical protein [Auraticoccus cholistanensis]|uniref:hypothetical protein n=1 Tax=Auraticoccus cholistanensis TaxID=2656650 RepID=UPI0012E84DD1|nr:hypothetical protein [Auraticoccus cholistanensis]
MSTAFDPGSWTKGATAITEEAAAFSRSATTTLGSSSDVGALGATGGSTLVDEAIATVLPPVFEEVAATIAALAEGLRQEADLMHATAAAYRDTEDAGELLGRRAGEV